MSLKTTIKWALAGVCLLVGVSIANAQNPVINFGVKKATGAAGNAVGGPNAGAAAAAAGGAITGGVASGVGAGMMFPNRTATGNQEATHMLQGVQNSGSRLAPPNTASNPAVNTSRTKK